MTERVDQFVTRIYNLAKENSLSIAKDLSTVNAVSYTHLRAHETVLDLVCRLLLEKKKNYINNR